MKSTSTSKLKLHQFVALTTGAKTAATTGLTEAHKLLQKTQLFQGVARKYKPLDDDATSPLGEPLPDEGNKVQAYAKALIQKAKSSLVEYFDLSLTRDLGNCVAKADVVVEGTTLLRDAPLTYLLFLEKQVKDLRTFVQKFPTLDSGEDWTHDPNTDLYRSMPVVTNRNKRITRGQLLAPATDKHPAQVKEVQEDVFAGTWTKTMFSSALPVQYVNECLGRIEKLLQAIVVARESANTVEVEKRTTGADILTYIFAA